MSHDLVAILDAQQRIHELSDAGRALLGLPFDAEVSTCRFDTFVTETDRSTVAALLTTATRDGASSRDAVLRTTSAEFHAMLVCVPRSSDPDTVATFTVIARRTDQAPPAESAIVERDRARFLARLERVFQQLDDAEEIMIGAARELGGQLGADRCAYAQAEADTDHFIMSGDHATGLPHLPGRFAMSAFGDGCLQAMRDGRPWVVADCRADARLTTDDLRAYDITGIRAVICVPLHKAGRFVAAMAVHQATIRPWTGATDGIWIVDHDLRFVEVNPAACLLLGYDRGELLGTHVTDLVGAGNALTLTSLIAALPSVGVITETWDVTRADGTIVALELSIQTTPTGLQAIGRDVTARRDAEAERELLLRRVHEIAQPCKRACSRVNFPRWSGSPPPPGTSPPRCTPKPVATGTKY